MFVSGGLYLPDGDTHFKRLGDQLVDYQRPQRKKAHSYVTDWSLAIDVGAHCGIFSRHFAQHFVKVLAFEPVPELRQCLALNTPANVEIMPYAVSDQVGRCLMLPMLDINSGGSFIADDARLDTHKVSLSTPGLLDVEQITIDSLRLERLGLIKIDVQGADHLVLAGAAETLVRCRPVVLVEEKPIGGPTGSTEHIAIIHTLMTKLGATAREKVGADRIFTF